MRYSEKEAFNTCPTKHRLTYEEGLSRVKDNVSVHHLKWGQGIHAGLDTRYKGGDYEAMCGAFKAEYPENLDDKDRAKTVEHGLEVLKRYMGHYAGQDKAWEVLASEHEGEIEIGGTEGHGLHIDLVAKHLQSGEIFFWDHKTTGKEPGAGYWKTYELSGQVTRYTEYIRQKYGHCGGCVINNIAVKHLLRKNRYGEGPGLVVRFERQLFNRTPQQVEHWKRSEEGWLKLMAFAKREGISPAALNSMCAYCEFYDLCLASEDEQIKELLYRDKAGADFEPVIDV